MENTLNSIPTPVMKPFNSSPATPPKLKNMTLALISVVVVLAGIGTGYLLSGIGSKMRLELQMISLFPTQQKEC